jgi:hypothetical protein
MLDTLEKIVVAKAASFLCVRSSLRESANTTEFQATEPCSSSHLTKAKCGISGLSKLGTGGKLLCELAPVNSVHMEKEKRQDMKIKSAISMNTQPKSLLQSARNIKEFPSLY